MFKKRGASHIEMIVSFTLFVTLVLFLFLIINPYRSNPSLSWTVLERVYVGFEEGTHTNLTEFFFGAIHDIQGNPKQCLKIGLNEDWFGYDFTVSKVWSVNNPEMKESYFKLVGVNNNLMVDDYETDGNLYYYKAAFSPEFVVGDFLEDACKEPVNLVIGTISERRIISNNSLTAISKKYYSNYSGLKEDLKIPKTFEFSVISNDIPEINMEKTVPDSAEVISKDYVVEVLYQDGTIINPILTFKLWQ